MNNKETLINHIEDKVPKLRFPGFTEPWEQYKLSEIATMHARIGWQNLRTSEFLDNGEYMIITGTDFENGVINYSACHFVERERYEQDKHIQIKNGNILITKDGTLGKVAYVQGLSMPATLNAGVFNVEIKDKAMVDNRYLFQYLKAPFLMDYVNKKATGGTIKHLNQNILVNFCVVIPSKIEQETISQYFTLFDNIITLHQNKLNILNKYKKGLLSYIFNNFSCVKSYNFKKIFVKYNEKNKSNYPQYTIGVNGIKLLESDRNNYDISNHKLFSPDSLILGIGINEVGISDCFGCCSPIYLTYKINTKIVNPVFAKYYIPIVFKKNKSLITRKSTRRDFELTKDVEDLLITIPLINEQDEIAKILSTFDELIEKENNILSLLKKYKQGLLQQMFI